MTPDRILGYTAMLSACLLFIFVGSMLSFAPARFSKWMRWWARQIHFPKSSNEETPDSSARRRMPGFALLCFGIFIFYKVFHSLLIDISVSIPKASGASLKAAAGNHTQFLTALFPVLFGFGLFVETDAILERFHDQAQEQSFRPARTLFRMIAVAAVLAGVSVFLRSSFKP
jgi:hypothetical protein